MSTLEAKGRSDSAGDRLVLIGSAIPEDVMHALMSADSNPQVQTHKLHWALIRGLESAGLTVDLISTVAISDFPQSRWLWSGYRKWERGNGSDNRLVPFINVLGWKHLTRFFGCLVMLVRWCLANRRRKRHVLLVGLLSPHLYAVRCARLLFALPTTVLITDLPGLSISRERWWRRMIRPLDRALVHRAVQSADRLIVLTQPIAADYAPALPALVMEGILSVQSEELASQRPARELSSHDFVILYAGGLHRRYGIPLLLDALARLPGDEFRLWLCGAGDMEDEIRRRSRDDPRICFLGLVPPPEVFRRCQAATVLINPRPSTEDFTRYSFPSKLLEYMAAGRPVLTTRLPGIPEEYASHVVWIDPETPESLAALLVQLRHTDPETLDGLGERARDFVLGEKNFQRQGRRIAEFMTHHQAAADSRR